MSKKEFEQVWHAVSRLRGAFEITDMLKLVMYLLLLKHIENNKNEFEMYDDKYSLDYLALTYGVLVQAGDVSDYICKIEKEMNLERGIMSESVVSIFAKMNKEKVIGICNALKVIEFSKELTCFDCATVMIEKTISEMGRRGGEFATNYSLAKLEAALLNVEEGMSVYDAYCGVGVSSNLAAGNKGTIFIQDINIGTVCIAAILTVLNKTSIGAIKCGDSILNPIGQKEKYDRVIMEPPFGVKYEKMFLENLVSDSIIYADNLDSETFAIRHAINSIKESGMAIVLVPMGVLFKSGKTGEIRERLIDDNYIDSIIELPAGVLTGTGIPVALMILKKNKVNHSIFMVDAKSFFEKDNKRLVSINDKMISNVSDIFSNKEPEEGISKFVEVEEINNNDCNLCPMQYLASKGTENIEVEDITVYVNQNNELSEKLSELEKKLSEIRARFVK